MARQSRLRGLAESILRAADLPDGGLVVALSGGADSAVLAWVARESGEAVRAIHVHHGLASSDAMASAASGVADRLDLPLEIIPIRVPDGPSWEAQAREVRYASLLDRLDPGSWLLTGHTADDQAETVLMNLLRGSGLAGLAGIPRRRHPIARPLLDLWRDDVRECATLMGLPWRDDPANVDQASLRNRIRRSLLPTIEAEYSAGFRQALVRTAALAATDTEILDDLADVTVESEAGRVRFIAGELAAVPQGVASRAIRNAMAEVFGPHPPPFETVARVLRMAAGEPGPADLADGLEARRRGPWIEISGTRSSGESPAAIPLRVPGMSVWGGWRFECHVADVRPIVPLSASGLVWPSDPPTPPVRVRPAGEGGTIAVAGGSKPVVEALAEAGVPPGDRTVWPVVEVGGVVVWLPWVRRAVWPRVGGSNYLCAVAVEERGWERSGR